MNWIRILFYPIIVIVSFFGNLFKHHGMIRDENVQLSSPLFVTPFIQRGELSKAKLKSRVTPDIEGIQTYSGFFTVNEACGNHLFFWFIPAEINWEKAPVVLWLNGGPGGSSLFGLFNEVGPWKFKNGKLVNNKFSWTKVANVLFIDQPVATGFSFSDQGCFAKDKQDVTRDLYSALIQFFTMFSELQKNKFFLAGMSFAGHYVPETAALIDEKNEVSEIKINLAGIIVGSPSIQNTCNYKGDLLYELGIADEHDRDLLQDLQEELVQLVAQDIQSAVDTDYQVQLKLQNIGLPNYFHILDDKPEPHDYEFSKYLKTSQIKEQIHVGDSSHQYSVINPDVFSHYVSAYYQESSASAIKYLLDKNYIVGFFNGQLDMICSYTYFDCVFKDMEWEGAEGYLSAANQPWYVSKQLVGWFKVFRNLFTIVVRNTGHNAPQDQGEIIFSLISSVLNSSPENLLKGF